MFDRAEKTVRLLNLFRSANGVLSHEAIEQAMGESRDELRQPISNVRKYLERDEGIVFACVRGEGYRRLSDAEKIESAGTFRQKIRRTAIRGVTRIDAVKDFASLSNQEQLMASIQKQVFEAIQREAATK